MRQPNPPTVFISTLVDEQQRKVIRLALLVVADLAADKAYDAYAKIEFANLTLEEYEALWSLLDSTQRSTIKSVQSCESSTPTKSITRL